MAKAVILNDTRGDNHFGCFRVMRVIEENLAARGIDVIGRSLVRNDWERDRAFLEHLDRADLILINGEGTPHHGNRQAERLLGIVNHPARGNRPVALINTIYQDNPPEWRSYLDRLALISTRDSQSAAEVSAVTGRSCGFVPDLSLGEGARATASASAAARTRLVVGDSVDRGTSAALRQIADTTPGAIFLPILRTLKPSKPHYRPLAYAMREAYIRSHAWWSSLRRGNIEFNRDEDGFITSLQSANLHVTGRFHAVCFCLFTSTPFLAVKSNSWKINALLEDFGLGTGRVLTVDEIRKKLASGEDLSFSEEEQAAIAKGLARAKAGTQDLFDRVAALTNSKG